MKNLKSFNEFMNQFSRFNESDVKRKTLKVSKSDMEKLHKDGKIDIEDITLTFESLINEGDSLDSRLETLSEDPKIQKSMGSANIKDLKYAFEILFKRGYGAAQTNWGAVNPNIQKLGKPAAYHAWGHARLNAFIDKRTAYKTSDKDVADWLKGDAEKPVSESDRIIENKKDDPREKGLFSEPGPGAVKGTGYKDKEKAEQSIVIINKLDDHKHAMSIATTMLNRADTHQHQTKGMRDAMKVFREWIDKNKKS